MKDVTSALRIAVIAKLRNNVSVDGSVVRVLGRTVPPSVGGTYIYLPTLSTDNESAKQYFSTDNTLTVECVYRNISDEYNSSGLDIMVDKVLQLLARQFQIDMPQPTGFGLVDFGYVSKNELVDYDGVGVFYRAVLTFEALIDE